MAIVMNMSSYVIEETSPADARYDVERANWNPQAQLAVQHAAIEPARHAVLPPSLANIDAEAFLQEMYACRR